MTTKRKLRVLGPACEHGKTPIFIEDSDGSAHFGHMRQPRPGEAVPLGSALTRITKDPDDPDLLHADTIYDTTLPRKGPARVSSPAYRQGWDTIWSKPKLSELN